MRLFVSAILVLFLSTTYSYSATMIHIPEPTDSSSSVFNRIAAAFLIDDGRKAFDNGRYLDALRKFREAYVRDPYGYKNALWIAEAHYALNNYGYALRYGTIAERMSKGKDGEVFFLLGRAYHRQGILDSAEMNYKLAEAQLSSMKRSAYNIKQCLTEVEFALSFAGHVTQFEKTLMDEDIINSGYDDYCAVYTPDGKGIYYVSRRPDTKGGNINPDDQHYFEDVYYVEWIDSLEEWSAPTNDLGRLNSDGFDALSDLSEDGKTAYLTINTSVLKQKNTTRSSDIFIAEMQPDGRWGRPREINASSVNTSFFDGAPTVTADGNTMYFVSDREGDKTKSDIYMVEKEGNKWGKAKKLPMNVNTKGNETTPFITPDGRYLFFSSDGRRGIGGYDVYVTERIGNEWTDPVNLGPDFNTVNDDMFFRYFPKLNKATLSSYRIQGNKASIDIFEVNVEGWKIPQN